MSDETSTTTVDRWAERAVLPTAVVTGALAAAWLWFVVAAPLDSVQGVVQKILYVHPPMAFSAYAGFFVTALGGAIYLWRRDAQWDRLAAAAAEVGVLFGALMIATGPIWARATWGKWWSWDLRLTLTLLLFLVYVSYLLLRSFTEGSEQVARFSAVYAIAGLAIIPLNYFAIELAGGRSIHPENVERSSFGEGMGLPFLLGVLTALAMFLHLLAHRIVNAGLAHQLAEREAEEGAAAWDT
jgi:heme exporter protein C